MATKLAATNQIKNPPTDDKRWRLVNATMRRLGYSPSALIETLHVVQRSFGFLDEVALRYVARSLHVPLSKVYGVATFYTHFRLKPQGLHTCVVCLGTACYIKGGSKLLAAAEQCTRIRTSETTADGKVSLLTARCLGACGIAPAVVFDGLILGHLTPEATKDRIDQWLRE
jgi:bidirectional [NiFe] hydrogenase diaphorase subunit